MPCEFDEISRHVPWPFVADISPVRVQMVTGADELGDNVTMLQLRDPPYTVVYLSICLSVYRQFLSAQLSEAPVYMCV